MNVLYSYPYFIIVEHFQFSIPSKPDFLTKLCNSDSNGFEHFKLIIHMLGETFTLKFLTDCFSYSCKWWRFKRVWRLVSLRASSTSIWSNQHLHARWPSKVFDTILLLSITFQPHWYNDIHKKNKRHNQRKNNTISTSFILQT